LLSIVVVPSFATPYTSGSHNGYVGGGFGGGSASGFAITSGQGHKDGFWDGLLLWLAEKAIDYLGSQPATMSSCGGKPCGGGGGRGF